MENHMSKKNRSDQRAAIIQNWLKCPAGSTAENRWFTKWLETCTEPAHLTNIFFATAKNPELQERVLAKAFEMFVALWKIRIPSDVKR